jgi:hypothetical protein
MKRVSVLFVVFTLLLTIQSASAQAPDPTPNNGEGQFKSVFLPFLSSMGVRQPAESNIYEPIDTDAAYQRVMSVVEDHIFFDETGEIVLQPVDPTLIGDDSIIFEELTRRIEHVNAVLKSGEVSINDLELKGKVSFDSDFYGRLERTNAISRTGYLDMVDVIPYEANVSASGIPANAKKPVQSFYYSVLLYKGIGWHFGCIDLGGNPLGIYKKYQLVYGMAYKDAKGTFFGTMLHDVAKGGVWGPHDIYWTKNYAICGL